MKGGEVTCGVICGPIAADYARVGGWGGEEDGAGRGWGYCVSWGRDKEKEKEPGEKGRGKSGRHILKGRQKEMREDSRVCW